MDLSQITTVLRVMNLTASYGMVWCAERYNVADSAYFKELGGEAQIRFYLVPDDSALLLGEGIIKV